MEKSIFFTAKPFSSDARVNFSGSKAMPLREEKLLLFKMQLELFMEQSNWNRSVRVGLLADKMAMSERQFYRYVQKAYGVSPSQLIDLFRKERSVIKSG